MAWELSGQGFNYREIAEKLGVSEKTIQRDIKKITPYYDRLSKKYYRDLKQQRMDNLNAELEGKTLFQRFNSLAKKMVDYKFLMKQREYNRRTLKIIIDMDDLTDGFPAIRFWLKPPITFRDRPYLFKIHIQQNSQQYYVGEISLHRCTVLIALRELD
jgi:transcriptional antiterminator